MKPYEKVDEFLQASNMHRKILQASEGDYQSMFDEAYGELERTQGKELLGMDISMVVDAFNDYYVGEGTPSNADYIESIKFKDAQSTGDKSLSEEGLRGINDAVEKYFGEHPLV
jgi:hypothetical protein